jgi:hypothetical protein
MGMSHLRGNLMTFCSSKYCYWLSFNRVYVNAECLVPYRAILIMKDRYFIPSRLIVRHLQKLKLTEGLSQEIPLKKRIEVKQKHAIDLFQGMFINRALPK